MNKRVDLLDLGDVQLEARDALARGAADGAVRLLRAAVGDGPTTLSLVHDLVRALRAAGEVDEAILTLQRLVLAAPHRLELHRQLVKMLQQADRKAAALAALRVARDHHPRDVGVCSAVVTLADELGASTAALAAAADLVALTPDNGDAWRRYAVVARKANDREHLGRALDGWFVAAPDNPSARHLHAAFHGQTPDVADAAYVTALFDAYAERFDQHLATLGYRAPEVLVAAVRQRSVHRPAAAADLGCGTGQVGALLRDEVDRLVGVDLSPGMLAKARDRDHYDELVHGELTAFLAERPNEFDLVVSADTIIYIGDLCPVFAAARASLRSGGLFGFTLEDAPVDEQGPYRLAASGRFVHRRTWVVEQLRAHGFADIDELSCVLRREEGHDVIGTVYTAVVHEEG